MNIPATMRAVQFDSYGSPDVLRVRTVPVPEPQPATVLVRVTAASVNAGWHRPWAPPIATPDDSRLASYKVPTGPSPGSGRLPA